MPSSDLCSRAKLLVVAMLLACSPESDSPADTEGLPSSATGRPATTSSGPSASTSAPDPTPNADGTTGPSSGDGLDDGTDPSLFDVGSAPDVGVPAATCTVPEGELSGVGPCTQQAPPDAFEPVLQWSWDYEFFPKSIVTIPLVVNLTDDDGNDTVDLCDIPDVVILPFFAYEGYDNSVAEYQGQIVVLSGDDGSEHFRTEQFLDAFMTPAVGDIDGDGLPEIVALSRDLRVIAFEHDGSLKWESDVATRQSLGYEAIALADLEGDGDVEILVADSVYEHTGALRWTLGFDYANAIRALMPTAADLDGDGDLEVIYGAEAYHADGSVYYTTPLSGGFPHVANFDDDDAPEIVVTNIEGLHLLQHDGTITWQDQRPTGDPPERNYWLKPATVHDFDGDGRSELATGSANNYALYEITPEAPTLEWQLMVSDLSGSSAGTAFDFDGDGRAEAMYSDQDNLFVLDALGNPLFVTPRVSGTLVEFPVVADVDNDGSAEILMVGDGVLLGVPSTEPSLRVFRDVDDRWIQARRIWNQHTYHVSNVREDGTIPTEEPPSWRGLNTFRTNAQIEGGQICQPEG